MRGTRPGRLVIWTALALVGTIPPAAAQAPAPSPPPPPPPAPQGGDDFPTRDSNVGYIDSPLPVSLFRLRFDAAYDERRPNRAEFFYPKGASAGGPGLPRPETRVDYQELSGYLEATVAPRLSVFAEVPVRFINPEVNRDATGLSDLNAGFKWAFVDQPDRVVTFQLRTYVPTGDTHSGLGNGHATVEPAVLAYQRLGDKLTLEGELRYWVPVGGTDFAGDIVRYGVGLSYGQPVPDEFWLAPVVEFVGWTALGGKEQASVSPTTFFVEGAAGDTIVNAKLGVRMGFGTRWDTYVGYGRALTGDTWYKDTVRAEVRFRF